MLKLISVLAVAAALSVAPAFAQETTNSGSGEAVDGHGSGGSLQNRLVPDGPGSDGGVVIRAHDGTCYVLGRDGGLIEAACSTGR